MLDAISTETLEAIFDTLPFDLTFVDDTDTVIYYNESEARIFKRTPQVIGTKVQDCHSPKSVSAVNQVIIDLKAGRKVVAYLTDRDGRKVSVRYFRVEDRNGKYLGVLEVAQDITDFQKVEEG